MSDKPSSTFQVSVLSTGLLSYKVSAKQILPVNQKKTFCFFEDFRNLYDITPAWLAFCILNRENLDVHENAQFEYTIKFLGISMICRSRIVDYHAPERFTDTQLQGPYRSWVHLHKLEKVQDGTRRRDEVTYKVPMPALFLHPLFI